ncbi:hypothetical protein L1049_021326 [Liquidambar formosana]|uniref:Uncharacterized protein n=1 Tax=Liquidambar formosana TaxID=63359 RepID=A0AAP0X504_LIQFO
MDQEFRGSASLLRAACNHKRNSNNLGEWKGCPSGLGNGSMYKEVFLRQVVRKSKSFNSLEASGINDGRHQLSTDSSNRVSLQKLKSAEPKLLTSVGPGIIAISSPISSHVG